MEALALLRGIDVAVTRKRPRPSSEPSEKPPRASPEFTSLGSLISSLRPLLGRAAVARARPPVSASAPSHVHAPVPPLDVDAAAWGLDASIVRALKHDGIVSFFPIQRAVIPSLLLADASADVTLGDASISAPTGSGKTLAFALPVIQSVLNARAGLDGSRGGAPRQRPLHALIVLPTRDLALQVFGVVSRYAAAAKDAACGAPIRVAAAIGQASFAAEQAAMIGDGEGVDILVASPGRLAEHLDSTPILGAAIAGLRLLVVDEADRLLASSYQDWVRRVNLAVFTARDPFTDGSSLERLAQWSAHAERVGGASEVVPGLWPTSFSRTWRGDAMRVGCVLTPIPAGVAEVPPSKHLLRRPTWLHGSKDSDGLSSSSQSGPSLICLPFRRIVCSATLTANPQKLAALGLRFPTHFTVKSSSGAVGSGMPFETSADGKRLYTLPPSVHQAMVVCSASDKPIALSVLLRALDRGAASGLKALVFTNSVETAHRLARLLQLLGGLFGRVVEFSATLSQAKRTAVLEAAAEGSISVLVASDAAARGLDLAALPCVIHYDAPSSVKTYVHRVGRTARAGAVGLSYAIVRPEQARHFRSMIGRTRGAADAPEHSSYAIETLLRATVSEETPRLTAALDALRRILEDERAGSLHVTADVEALKMEAEGGNE